MYGISEIAATKSLVVASSVWVLPRRLLLVGVIPTIPKISTSYWLCTPHYAGTMGLYYLQMGRNDVLQQLDMADDADHVAAPAHAFQNVHGVMDGTDIQRTESFVDKQHFDLHAGFLGDCGHADGKGQRHQKLLAAGKHATLLPSVSGLLLLGD